MKHEGGWWHNVLYNVGNRMGVFSMSEFLFVSATLDNLESVKSSRRKQYNLIGLAAYLTASRADGADVVHNYDSW